MANPIHKDSLTSYQKALSSFLKITSPVSALFTGKEIIPDPNSRSVRIPDIRVDDLIEDAELGRIGPDHFSVRC